ncbi:MAG TPA: putative lipid II flippase FtsW [Bryobacteraceae bacterium]|nr:putative lipid II flippase FtsW [Bryobacteraceae bacterium]
MAQRVKTDRLLLWCVAGLVCFGLVMVYSASSVVAQVKYGSSGYYIYRQLAFAAGGLIGMLWLMRKDYRDLNKPLWAFGSIAVVLILLAIVYFVDLRAHRWLRLGPVGIQPSEFAKPALILFLSFFITRRGKTLNSGKPLIAAMVTILLLAVAVVIADLGTAAVLVITAGVMFFVAGLERKYIRYVVLIGVVGFCGAIMSKPYRLIRIFGFLDPQYKILDVIPKGQKLREYMARSSYNKDPGYHVRQSKIAVGSGGILGQGLMDGKQKLFYLPEAHTDFIYAVVGEELGLVGCASVLVMFLVILWRGLQLVRLTTDDFGRYLALGVTTVIVVQALMNMSVVLNMAPTKGIPLPMISYGGSSLMSTLLSFGMLLSVSEQSG